MHDFKWVKNFSKQKENFDINQNFLKSKPELRARELFFKPKKNWSSSPRPSR